MATLALCGGEPVRRERFPAYNTMGEEEKRAACRVLDSGNLSQYLGVWHDDFMGGPEVRQFEEAWAQHFGVRHALAVNSATSGLYAAVGACGVGPGDEVIVSPYTMSASAIAAAAYGAVPVFADISPTTFCITPETIRERLTPRTRAILVVHIFGHPADMNGIMALARQPGIKVIEDCAQAPGALYHGRPVGALGDVGIFSLNYHKHVHTGEGGMVTTNDDELARRVSVIRNHAETIVGDMGRPDLAGLVGYNYRLTELQAAIGTEQLRKLPRLVDERLQNVEYLRARLAGIPGLDWADAEPGCRHVYYVWVAHFDASVWGVHRDLFVQAMEKELPTAHLRETTTLIGAGYVSPLYLLPIYQQRVLPCSFNCPRYKGTVDYSRGICPVTERMHFEELFDHEFMRPGMTHADLDDVVRAFEKVWTHRDELRGLAERTLGTSTEAT
ncbi:MAG: DegT/DnrJ/EryC1/StrS family aminotransferase [bacterium]